MEATKVHSLHDDQIITIALDSDEADLAGNYQSTTIVGNTGTQQVADVDTHDYSDENAS